jgi:4-hydroxy-tetrahydrodipicolinate reductase
VTRVCVAGIIGWTGSALAAAVEAADDLELVSGVSRTAGEERIFRSVAGTLLAVRAVVDRAGLTRGLDALLA